MQFTAAERRSRPDFIVLDAMVVEVLFQTFIYVRSILRFW